MINQTLLYQNLRNVFQNQALYGLLLEAYEGSLPFHLEEFSRDELGELRRLGQSVLESLGGFSLLDEAISVQKDPLKKVFLEDLKDVCMEAAEAATKDRASKVKVKDRFDGKKIVDSASFSSEEIRALSAKADSLNLNDIQGIIKKKVIDTIHAEQEATEKNEELDADLKEVINKRKGLAGTTIESYCDTVLAPLDPRSHVSIFSKINDYVMESVRRVSDLQGEVSMAAVRSAMMQHILPELCGATPTEVQTLESLLEELTQPEEEPTPETCSKQGAASLIGTVLLYTFLETLKTFNLFTPSMANIGAFLQSTPNALGDQKNQKGAVMERLSERVNQLRRGLRKKKGSLSVQSVSEQYHSLLDTTLDLEDVVQRLHPTLEGTSAMESLSWATRELTDMEASLKSELQAMEAQMGLPEKLPLYEQRKKDTDTSEFTRINTRFGRDPRVSRINMIVNPKTNLLQVSALESTQLPPLATTYVQLEHQPKNAITYVKDAIAHSKLKDTKIPICLIHSETGASELL